LSAILAVVAMLGDAACGSGWDASADSRDPALEVGTTGAAADEDGAVRPCGEDRHGVVIDVDGTLTADGGALLVAVANPGYDPAVHPGAVELMQAWRALGYEIVYLTGRPAGVNVGSLSMADATGSWLEAHGFPTGDGTHVFVWDARAIDRIERYKTQTLVGLTTEGLSLDYGYTGTWTDVIAYRTAGIPADHIFTIGEASDPEEGTVAVSDPSWLPHQVKVVDPLPPVCDA
jgi:phosphatidate phosphatase PAH1